MRKRYKISAFAGVQNILDTDNGRVFSFGAGFDWSHVPYQHHREQYHEVDAICLVQWLNERAADYPRTTSAPQRPCRVCGLCNCVRHRK